MPKQTPGKNLTILAVSLANMLADMLNADTLKLLASFLGTLSNNLFLILAERDDSNVDE